MENEYKDIPIFTNEDEERSFWAIQDSTKFVDWDKAENIILPNLKPSTEIIRLRLPELMLNELKLIANKLDGPYQSLIKMFLKERIDHELKRYMDDSVILSTEKQGGLFA
ncbi:MAG: hypothetical protein B6242_10705 [Anaerolineaceae bacterium 4572_78]|nr:MAG: hypothetical protein B6242_10705 [Anaerolineaceae bacterium 4572_78]